MKSDTNSYIQLQNLHPEAAELEKNEFIEILVEKHPDVTKSASPDEVEMLMENAHHLHVLRGKQWGRSTRILRLSVSIMISPSTYIVTIHTQLYHFPPMYTFCTLLLL
ncbi:hypothetical protein C8Q74DRAFT_1247929, partial [Fomes fomentarius]